jgi:predicted metal-dependent hydrolase
VKFNSIKLVGKFLWVHTTAPKNTQKVKALLDDWYREHARLIFARRLKTCHQRATHYGIPLPDIHIRRMKTRWGSYSGNGSIVLNLDLIRMPIPCIDYVIMHELCHIKYQDHSPKYYEFLSKCMPDWEGRRIRLNIMSAQ